MKEHDSDIEKLIDKVMKEHILQEPSFDFTSKVMAQVMAPSTKFIKYQPLISRTGWAIIFGSIIALCIYVLAETVPQDNKYEVELKMLFESKLSKALSGIHFSEITMYALLIIAFLILIQIPILHNHFEKRNHT